MKVVSSSLKVVRSVPVVGKKATGFLDALLGGLLRIPIAGKFVNRIGINVIASYTSARPRPFSLWSEVPKPAGDDNQGPISDYTSWPSLTDRDFSGRHLPPAPQSYIDSLPKEAPFDWASQKGGPVTDLFRRTGPMVTSRSSLLFMFFAQWFTDSVLRVHPLDRRKNTSNHDIDLCQIYGLNTATERLLRSGVGGRLRTQQIGEEEFPDYLCEKAGVGWTVRPQYAEMITDKHLDNLLQGFPASRREKLYATGLERGNSSVGYVAISTLFIREHNRLCKELERQHRRWNDERLFQTARVVNTVLLLKLVVEDYINHIVNGKLFRMDVGFAEQEDWYRTNWIALEFDLLYRWHGLVPDTMKVNGKECPAQDFRNNNALLEQVGIGSIITSASSQQAGRISLLNTPDFLLRAEYETVKMGRDFCLQPFNDYREQFGLPRISEFEELTSDVAVQEKLRKLYGTMDKVEYVVGLFAEEADSGDLFGSLLHRMVAYDAFTQIFTNPLLSRNIYNAATFTDYGLSVIEQTRSIQDLANRNIRGGGVTASLTFSA